MDSSKFKDGIVYFRKLGMKKLTLWWNIEDDLTTNWKSKQNLNIVLIKPLHSASNEYFQNTFLRRYQKHIDILV